MYVLKDYLFCTFNGCKVWENRTADFLSKLQGEGEYNATIQKVFY